MVPARVVAWLKLPAALAYCTDQPVTSTGRLPRLWSSTKSFLKEAPAFPPPPYTWLITTVPARQRGPGAAVVKPVAEVYAAQPLPLGSCAAVVTRTWKVEPYDSFGAGVSVAMVLPPDIAGAADAKPMHVAKLSVDTWTLPEHGPELVCAVSVAGTIATLKVTAIVE